MNDQRKNLNKCGFMVLSYENTAVVVKACDVIAVIPQHDHTLLTLKGHPQEASLLRVVNTVDEVADELLKALPES